MSEAIVRARIDEHLKSEASAILSSMGLSLSDAIRMLLVRVVADKAIPFDVKAPNAITIAAIEAARKGDVEKVTLEQLADEWNEE